MLASLFKSTKTCSSLKTLTKGTTIPDEIPKEPYTEPTRKDITQSTGSSILINSFKPLSIKDSTLYDLKLTGVPNGGFYTLRIPDGNTLTTTGCGSPLYAESRHFGVGAQNFDLVYCNNNFIGIVGDESVRGTGVNNRSVDTPGGPYRGVVLLNGKWSDEWNGYKAYTAKFEFINNYGAISYRVFKAIKSNTGTLQVARMEAYNAADQLINAYAYGYPAGNSYTKYLDIISKGKSGLLIPYSSQNQQALTRGKLNSVIKTVGAAGNNKISSSGTYEFTLGNGSKVRQSLVVSSAGEHSVSFFDDTNSNGVYDQGEKILEDNQISITKVEKLAEAHKYSLTPGWNLIHFDFIPSEFNTAKEFNQYLLDNQLTTFTHIAQYINGNFDLYSFRDGEWFGQDFEIVPGKGIFVYMSIDGAIELNLMGKSILTKVPVTLVNGWNLVGFAGYSELNTDKLFTSAEQQGIKLNIVSSFRNGIYDSVILDSGNKYGNSYDLIGQSGYFLRIDSTNGNTFTP